MNRLIDSFSKLVCVSLVLLVALAWVPATALALPVIIPDFAVDPSGAAFTIQGVTNVGTDPVADPGLINAPTPSLDFNILAENDLANTDDTLRMSWIPTTADTLSQSGWELVFGADPDLSNGTIELSVMAPGGIDSGSSMFAGISQMSVVALEPGGTVIGGWGFNTDEFGTGPPLGSDPTASGAFSSIENNIMHDVVLSVPANNSPVTGASATITPLAGPPAVRVGPNYIISGSNQWANVLTLQFFENGILRGSTTSVIPGQSTPGLLNYWDHLTVTVPQEAPVPEPSTSALALLGILGFVARRRRRRQA